MGSVLIEGRGRGTYIRYIGLALPELPKKLREAQLEALMDCAHFWLKTHGHRHFELGAYTRYGNREEKVYPWRTKNHRRADAMGQRRGKNMRDPLVWTGNLRMQFMRGMVLAPTKSGEIKVKASWPALPKYVYYTKYGKNRNEGPRMYRELTIMTEGEEKELAERFVKIMQKHLDKEGE
jgi:hypothetical protein